MDGEMKCDRCGKDAIGRESFGCCSSYVCIDHASALLREIRPGKTLVSGECYLERFALPGKTSGNGDA